MRSKTVIIIILALVVFGLLIGVISHRTRQSGPSSVAFTGASFPDSGRMNLLLVINPPSTLSRESATSIEINSIRYWYESGEMQADLLCLQSATILENPFGEGTPGRSNFSGSERCFREDSSFSLVAAVGRNGTTVAREPEDIEEWKESTELRIGEITTLFYGRGYTLAENETITLLALARPDSFWYPFDDFRIDFTINVHYQLRRAGQVLVEDTIAPNLSVSDSNPDEWRTAISVTRGHRLSDTFTQLNPSVEDFGNYDRVSGEFDRLSIRKISYPIILFSLFASILFLGQVQSVDTFVEGLIALLLALFTLRELLLPPSAEIFTFIDAFILLQYMAFGLLVIAFFVNHTLKKEPIEQTHGTHIRSVCRRETERAKEALDDAETTEKPTVERCLSVLTLLGLFSTSLLLLWKVWRWLTSLKRN